MEDLIVGAVAILTGLTLILLALWSTNDRQIRCIEAMKDKPAAEIVVVCK